MFLDGERYNDNGSNVPVEGTSVSMFFFPRSPLAWDASETIASVIGKKSENRRRGREKGHFLDSRLATEIERSSVISTDIAGRSGKCTNSATTCSRWLAVNELQSTMNNMSIVPVIDAVGSDLETKRQKQLIFNKDFYECDCIHL